jgi:uncharacterized protein with von Willebrand factor type A (vWA) domain
VTGKPVAYDAHAYPYFFNDLNGDGTWQIADEAKFPNSYKSWTPRLLRAAYNYQFLAKEPGAYAHNPRYAMQLAYDSLEDLSSKGSGRHGRHETPLMATIAELTRSHGSGTSRAAF